MAHHPRPLPRFGFGNDALGSLKKAGERVLAKRQAGGMSISEEESEKVPGIHRRALKDGNRSDKRWQVRTSRTPIQRTATRASHELSRRNRTATSHSSTALTRWRSRRPVSQRHLLDLGSQPHRQLPGGDGDSVGAADSNTMASGMLGTLAHSRELKDAGIDPDQAGAITHVVQQAAEHGDPATRADLSAHRAEVRADLAAFEARLIKWMIGIAITATGIVVAAGTALVIAVLRALG